MITQPNPAAWHNALRTGLAALLMLGLNTTLLGQSSSATIRFGENPGHRIATHVGEAALAIVPLGSIEYHGPSGPPLTDSIIAEGMAGRVAAGVNASLFPVVNFTHCPAHTAGFQGSLSVRPEVVTMLLADILRSLVANGFTKVLLLNGHDGNIGPARMAVSQVTREAPKTQMTLISWWETLPTPEVETLDLFTSENGGHGHGGPLELSVAAAFAPQSVEAARGPDLPGLVSDAGFPYYLEKSDTTGWPGYSGKLSEISARKGEQLAEIAVDKISGFVRHWLKNDSRPGSW